MTRLSHQESVWWSRCLVFQELGEVVQLLLIVSILHACANELFASLVRYNVAQGDFGWEQYVRQRV